MCRWITAPLCLLTTLLAFSTQAEPLQAIYSDWQVSCDNLNHCVARNSQDGQELVMKISREAGPEGKSSVSIDYQRNSDEQNADAPIASRLQMNGKTLSFNHREWDVSKKHLSTNNRLVVNDFIAAIREGSAISLAGKADPAQPVKPEISLKGIKAALLAIDAQQGRVGTRTAWINRGAKPANTVPPIPATPVLSRFSEPQALTESEISAITQNAATTIENNDCSLDPSEREVHIFALSSDKALMTVNCDMGAYNLFALGFLVNRQAPYKMEDLALNMPFKLGEDDESPELINADFDPKTGILSTYDKGRGVGDCGVSSRWVFDGKAFRLAAFASEPSCDGYSSGGEWPVLWVTQVP
jgi:invasion protein IalB